MALRSARMKRVDLVVLAKDERAVTSALGRLGILHLVEIGPEEEGGALKRPNLALDVEKCRSLLIELDIIREKIGLADMPAPADLPYQPMDALADRVVGIAARVDALVEQRAKLEAESEKVQDELARLEALGQLTVPLSRLVDSPFLHFKVGVIKATDLLLLQAAAAEEEVILLDAPNGPNTSRLIAISSRKGRFALESLLRRFNFEGEDLSALPRGTPVKVTASLNQRADVLRGQHGQLAEQRAEMAERLGPDIASLQRSLRLEQALLEAQLNFGHTTSAFVIRGWLPTSVVPAMSEEMLKVTEGRMVLHVRGPRETGTPPEDVPVLLKNNRFFRPFEVLVRGIGMPRYDEIEPTVFIGLSFLVMYGLMFGDVGQGLVLAAVGFMMYRKSRDQAVRDIGMVVLYAGIAGALGGFLYGSVFGQEEMLAPLWLKPLPGAEGEAGGSNNQLILLGVAIGIGFALISLGIILNIINRLRMHDALEGLIDRFGLLGILFYWGVIGYALHAALSPSGGGSLSVVVLLMLPLVIIFLRGPIFKRLRPSKEHGEDEGFVNTAMHGGIEVMETVIAFLANTLSFARVGAFALAHAGLCMAMNSVAEQVHGVPGAGLVVLILGNALIIGLEGLVVFVQCLRLEYYEFFGKFFSGSGRKYQPFKLEREI